MGAILILPFRASWALAALAIAGSSKGDLPQKGASMKALRVLLSVVALAWACTGLAETLPVNGIPAGAKLIQEIDCAQPNKDLLFMEYPAGISKVETILGRPCRTLSNKDGAQKYFAYRIGEGKGLKGGSAYLLSVEYPEDQPRTIYVCNWGCETALGFATGKSVGDVVKGKYVPNNPESLNYPALGQVPDLDAVLPSA